MALKPNNNKPVSETDLGPFLTTVNEAATRVRGLWLGYIALLAYLFISVAAVTHRDLLLENPVNLPVLQVKLPLIGFFAVAPMLFLINHFFLLLQLFGLGQRLREFNDEIAKTDLDEAARGQVRRKLDTFTIVQMLAGPKKDREQVTGMFQRVIAIITLVIAPIMLLLIIQLQFLPYQDELVTWMHRLILAIDLVLLWMFWPSIKLGDWAPWRGKRLPKWQGRVHWRDYMVSWRHCCVSWWQTLAIMVVMVFACTVATFPGEIADGGINAQDWSKPADSNLSWLKGQLFGELEPSVSGELEPSKIHEQLNPFSRAIDLADDKTLIDLGSFDKINKRHRDNKDNLKPWETGRTLSLRNRNLRGAKFARADLRNVDFFAARLQSASLEWASLQGASFEWANLQGASLEGARLQGASFEWASLQGASFEYANLQGANLYDARLQGASLEGARLQGANLYNALLQGASLEWASLEGAMLGSASLQGALLDHANLQGANLYNALLQDASLDNTNLQGAWLSDASLQGASLRKTRLWRAYGVPDRDRLEPVWVEAPQLAPLSQEILANFVKQLLEDVTSVDVKEQIQKRLAWLFDSGNDVRNLPESFWTDLVGNVSGVDYRKYLAERLEKRICNDKGIILFATGSTPYIAQGLIKNRLEDIGPDHLPRVARRLLDDAEGRTNVCPGLKKVDAESISKLRKWAK